MRVLITGASHGIGGAIARRFALEGQRDSVPTAIALTSTGRKSDANELGDELRSFGSKVVVLQGDLSELSTPARIVQEAESELGGLDALISNAGLTSPAALLDLTHEAWLKTFAVDTTATWLLAKAAHRTLKENRGAIVAVSSASGVLPHPGHGAYSAAKAALNMLCRQMAQEWGSDGIRVNAVAPGMIRTPLTEGLYQIDSIALKRAELVPLGRVGSSADVAAAVAYLAGQQSSFITGQILILDGGLGDSVLGTIPGLPRSYLGS